MGSEVMYVSGDRRVKTVMVARGAPAVLVLGLIPSSHLQSLSSAQAESSSPNNQRYTTFPSLLRKPLSVHLCTESDESCILGHP